MKQYTIIELTREELVKRVEESRREVERYEIMFKGNYRITQVDIMMRNKHKEELEKYEPFLEFDREVYYICDGKLVNLSF